MEARQKLSQERHRLALRFGLSESDIEPELVPLMLTVEQSINKIDQAAGKINESVKPVVYNNHYDRNASAWTALWGNISTGIARHIVAVLLVVLSFLVCCVGYFGEVDHLIPWQIDHLIIWRPVAEKSCRSSFKNS